MRTPPDSNRPIRGRGAISNRSSRFLQHHSHWEPEQPAEAEEHRGRIPATELHVDRARSIITRNESPDVPFDRSINPYRGCEHGCIYCFARPSHAYLDLSPGLDFETRIFYKPDGPQLLEAALEKRNYRCAPIVLGTNTDPYQPVDQRLSLTRELLLVLQRYRHPVSIITKGSHVLRDRDILEAMAEDSLCSVTVSMTTLDNGLKRTLEPRTASPRSRLDTVAQLSAAGVPVGVLVAPVIPMINDQEMEAILEASAKAGAQTAGYVFLRLPREVRDLFYEWLHEHYPQRAEHVISLIRQSRAGGDYQNQFGQRMRGTGVFAELISQRFRKACARLQLNRRESVELNCDLFAVPPNKGPRESEAQLSLF
ncbi:PA0069 family radical SAM protein [Gilvimarinus sp. F26214L]|uniref:PA0069 family radical SAM protein n=1 Tax=Gilvimarinus sp. DZF01 TaxID=3461371 RepID=UPI00404524D7